VSNRRAQIEFTGTRQRHMENDYKKMHWTPTGSVPMDHDDDNDDDVYNSFIHSFIHSLGKFT